MDRIATFKAFADKQPDDPFPLYSLAMEYAKQGDRDQAQAEFDRLLDKFPDYVAQYFHAGANLVALGRKDEAAERYRAGLDVAQRAGDQKTVEEIRGALADIGG